MSGVALAALRSLPGVRRAWPGRAGELTFESGDDLGRLRAGRVTPDGRSELVPYAADPRLPGLRPDAPGRLVVHRLGRRAVVLGERQASKFVRPGRAAAIAEASSLIAEACGRAGIRAARVLASSDSRIDFALLPGRTLHELGDAGAAGWERFAELWPRLARSEPWAGMPVHDARDEAGVLRRWLGLARDFDALDEPRRMERAVDRACGTLLDGEGTLVIAHRDLHDKQILWDGAQLGLLDLDTAAMAEASLDLANLLAHLELRHAQGLLPAAARERAVGLLERAAGGLPVRPDRLACHLLAARLRIAMVYAFRPSASSWLPAWTERCLREAEAPLAHPAFP